MVLPTLSPSIAHGTHISVRTLVPNTAIKSQYIIDLYRMYQTMYHEFFTEIMCSKVSKCAAGNLSASAWKWTTRDNHQGTCGNTLETRCPYKPLEENEMYVSKVSKP